MEDLVHLNASEIDAVVFDIGGVFVIRHWEPVCRGMGRGGHTIDPDPVRFHEAHHHAVRALSSRIDGGPIDEYASDFWSHYERAYLSHLGIGPGELDSAVATMHHEVIGKEPKPLWRQLLVDNIAAFNRIVDAGIPVAIVSNNDGTAERQMIDFGICQVGPGSLRSVAAIVDSGALGVAKPDPAIFTPALNALGVAAHRALYVGDTVHADVIGATAAGMPVVQLDPYDLHGDFDHVRFPDVAAIADFLLL